MTQPGPNSLKWLLTGRLGVPGRVYGYVGPRFIEAVQTGHHLLTGHYVAYTHPGLLARSRWLLPLGAFESGLRGARGSYVRHLTSKPFDVRQPVHFQSIMVIQPIDVLPDGRQDMCDGCPDVTVHEGKLVWSCRLEERLKFGGLIETVPKEAPPARLPQPSPPTGSAQPH